METDVVRCLSNSISRFIHLVSCCAPKSMACQTEYRDIANSLKLLKPILDDVTGAKVSSPHGILHKEYEDLDAAVNEAREFIEIWSPNKSKIYGVVRSRRLLERIKDYSFSICRIISRFSESSLPLTEIQYCMQKFQSLKPEIVSEYIEEGLNNIREGVIPSSDLLRELAEWLGLTVSQELLKESIAIEKEKMKANASESNGESEFIDQAVNLLSHICNGLLKYESFNSVSGGFIPSYFRCSLSLGLMCDPVIVASGQTYDRDSIQTWLDHGLTVCPITHQVLLHSNLIPNYTLRALVSNWCDENKVNLAKPSSDPDKLILPSKYEDSSSHATAQMEEYNHSLHSSSRRSKSSIVSEEEYSVCQSREDDKLDQSSLDQSYTHSRSGSTSTAVSSIDYLQSDAPKISSKNENFSEVSGELTSDFPLFPRNEIKQCLSSSQMDEGTANGDRSYPRTFSLPSDSGLNDLTTTTSHVEKLVKDLKSSSKEAQTKASAELRYLAKHNMENRIIIGKCGAIEPLLSLLHSNVKLTQEHAVTALLNLSINGNIKSMIAEAGALEPLIHVLNTGNSGAKENAAAAFFSLSVIEEYRVKIGRSGAVKTLVDLLGAGTLRGKKDAATALFNLSIFHENKVRIIQAGAVKYLMELLDPTTEMVDKAVALLANLSTVTEGSLAISREGGIPMLVEVIEMGSSRGKENAASVLLQLCLSSPKCCRLVLQEGAIPPLVALSQSGTPRAREKAQQLLSHFRSQRENSVGRGKP